MTENRYWNITVAPNAKKTELVSEQGRNLKIKLKAKPVDDAANTELIRFLAEKFDIAKSKITIKHGLKSKNKLVQIDL